MALVTINISGSPIEGAYDSPKTKTALYELVRGNDVILQVGSNTKFDRVLNAYWQTLAHATSFRVAHEDLGGLFEVVSQREAMQANRPALKVVK